jgi:hypothetical protein
MAKGTEHMKLAAGNPNLMRVNKQATLGEFARPLKTTYKYGQSGGYVPMVRTPDMATPRTFNHMKDGQIYKPDNSPPARAGATDALQIQSRGFKT